MTKKFSVCVFCGASSAPAAPFMSEAKRFGGMLAGAGYHMVYGAGESGLMGAAADGALAAGGTVTGVYPHLLKGLEREHAGLTELIHVKDMHTRKMTMFERSDAFVILPGGFGTMDETFEVITWKQLNAHQKPVILYNYMGYWEDWRVMTDRFIERGFASPATKGCYDLAESAEETMRLLHSASARLAVA